MMTIATAAMYHEKVLINSERRAPLKSIVYPSRSSPEYVLRYCSCATVAEAKAEINRLRETEVEENNGKRFMLC